MTMQKTDLEKRQGLKLENRRRQAEGADRFGRKSGNGSKAGTGGAALNPLVGALLARGKKD